jgi:DNA end-binding protein Ku
MPALGHVYWRGFLRLQLVSINVDIYSAAESASEIRFNQIHKPTGKRIKYEKVVPGVGPVENADIVKGYQIEPDVYVTMEPEEIEAIRLESKKTIDKDAPLWWGTSTQKSSLKGRPSKLTILHHVSPGR